MTVVVPQITIYCVAYLLWLSMFFSLIDGQRDVIECTVRDGETSIHLRLKRTEQLLANENLPVWTAKGRRSSRPGGSVVHKLEHNLVKDSIGDFILYHDIENSAALVLFVRTQTLTGVVDTRYAITALPLDHCPHGAHLGRGYVEYLNCESMNHQDHLKSLDQVMHGRIDAPINRHHSDMLMQHDSVTTLFIEVMVFNTYDLTKIARDASPNEYLAVIVAQYIIYLNAVDMLISKFSTYNIKVHVNLAGIVIEDEPNVFNWFTRYENSHFIDAEKACSIFPWYGSEYYKTFPRDSFDVYLISTRYPMWAASSNIEIDGVSSYVNVYQQRSRPNSILNWSGVAVRFNCGYEYISAAHEIAHTMEVQHDPLNKGICKPNKQCYGLMQRENQYCPDCIKWSEESIQDLERYVRHNRDHCFLLNKPRSLYPFGSLIMTLSPLDQCRCYGFQPGISIYETSNVIPRGGCARSLKCNRFSPDLPIPVPVDGTPCKNGVRDVKALPISY